MTFDDVVGWLGKQRHGVVASIAPGRAPQSAVVGIAVSPAGEIVFDTLLDTRKARNLTAEPRVSLTVFAGEQTVQLDGRADRLEGAELQRLLKVYLAAWPDGAERLKWPGISHFRITPKWVRWSDFAAAGGPQVVAFDR
jgi:hypothetical protein